MNIFILIYFLLVHYFADFFLQSEWEANNKWNNHHALRGHVTSYFLALFVAALLVEPNLNGFIIAFSFAVINGWSHYLIDYVTSKLSHRFFVDEKRIRAGFKIVGFDQWCHVSILALTWYYLIG